MPKNSKYIARFAKILLMLTNKYGCKVFHVFIFFDINYKLQIHSCYFKICSGRNVKVIKAVLYWKYQFTRHLNIIYSFARTFVVIFKTSIIDNIKRQKKNLLKLSNNQIPRFFKSIIKFSKFLLSYLKSAWSIISKGEKIFYFLLNLQKSRTTRFLGFR